LSYRELITKLKSEGKGLMSETQYCRVGQTIELLSPCNFLIFGLGEDANMWKEINKNGRTVFLEDDLGWIKKFNGCNLEIYSVSYNTKAQDHINIGFDVDSLKIEIPDEVTEVKWDIIFVDGPLGHNPPRPYKGPGRMQSIYTAYSLLKDGGICIIDDMARVIENTYSIHFFGHDNLYDIIDGKVGFF